MDCINLIFDLISVKNGDPTIFVGFHSDRVARDQSFHEIFSQSVASIAFDKDLFDLLRVEVSDRPFDEVCFLIDQGGCGRGKSEFADLIPLFHEVVVVAFNFRFRPLGARGSDNNGYPILDV